MEDRSVDRPAKHQNNRGKFEEADEEEELMLEGDDNVDELEGEEGEEKSRNRVNRSNNWGGGRDSPDFNR